MSWLEMLLRPFRGRPADATPAPEETREPTPAPPATRKAAPTGAARPPAPARDGDGKRRKSRKDAKKAAPAPAPAPVAEVLTVEEAERRYGAMVAPRPPAPATGPAAGPAVPEPADPPSDPARRSEPPPPRTPRQPGRPSEAAENRRRARIPQLEALLSRTDALLAVADADPKHLASARRRLRDEWERLGPPPAERAAELDGARDARIAALDARLAAAAASDEAAAQDRLARRWAVVEEARALAERDDLKGAGPEMGQLRAKLRAIEKVTAPEPTAVAFAEAEARLAARQQQQRDDRETARKEQLDKLEQLVTRAEALVRSKDPEAAAERVKALQATWKTVRVPGPRAEVDAAWARFRAACDAVFTSRAIARDEAARVTLEKMEAIVGRLEGLVETGIDGDPEAEIGRALTEWKRAGRAPREAQQRLWERMQAAFDQIRSPSVDLGAQDDAALQFRPFAALAPPSAAVAAPPPEPPEPVVAAPVVAPRPVEATPDPARRGEPTEPR